MEENRVVADCAGYYEGANERIFARVPAAARRILDVGCAAGRLGEILKSGEAQHKAKDTAGAERKEVWGIELVPEVAAEAKARLDHVLVGDIERMDPLPLPERYFDCLICGDVLEHLRNPEGVLRRLRKHLQPGATVIVNVPNIAHWSVIAQLLQGRFDYEDKGLLDRTHVHFFTPATLRETLWEAGYLVTDGDALVLGNELPRELAREFAGLGFSGVHAGAQRTQKFAEGDSPTYAIYQQLYVAKPVPDPYNEPEKMAQLVGPHIGKLGPASKRCSVVILTYNSRKTIETCLNSVLPTLGPNDELIVVDNASEDGTQSYLQSLQNQAIGIQKSAIKLILNDENFGFSKGCNIGILESKGEFIILLNPDTEVYPGWIEGLLAPFADTQTAATGPLSDNVCGDQFVGLYLPREKMTSPEAVAAIVHSPQSAIGNQKSAIPTKLLIGFCLALRRQALDQFGLLEETCFLGADDLEISWRLQMLGFHLAIAKPIFVSHRGDQSFASIGQDRKSAAVASSDAALIAKLSTYYGTPVLPTSEEIWGNSIFRAAMILNIRGPVPG